MQIETTGKLEDVSFTVRATVRNSLRDERFREALGVDVQKDDRSREEQTAANYCYVAGHVVSIDGVDWQPPDTAASTKAIRANYEQYLDSVPRRVDVALLQAINKLYRPTASAVEKPDSAVTEDEAADPK